MNHWKIRTGEACEEGSTRSVWSLNSLTAVGFVGKREIIAESDEVEPLLRQIADRRLTVVLAGQRERERCSPVLLWARESK